MYSGTKVLYSRRASDIPCASSKSESIQKHTNLYVVNSKIKGVTL